MDDTAAVLTDEAVAVRVRVDAPRLVEGSDLVEYDLHVEALADDGSWGRPFASGTGYREPLASLLQLQSTLGDLVSGRTRAAQHETFEEGFDLLVEAHDEGDRFRVEWWVDLSRASRALRLRPVPKGQRQVGLRLTASRAGLELFRQQLGARLRGLLS